MARSISWATFKKALSTNPKVRFSASRTTKAAMVYLYLPKHNESDARGLWELLAVPSPTFFDRLQRNDVEVDGKGIRGYAQFFRAVCKMKDPTGASVLSKEKIRAIIPDAFQRFDSRTFRRDVKKKNTSEFEKLQEKLKQTLRPIKGYGDPVGGRRETNTVYTFGPS